MPAPLFQFYHDDSTPEAGTVVDTGNPLEFGVVDRARTSATVVVHVWNDKGGSLGSDTAVAPRFYADNGPDNIDDMFDGTAANDTESMIEARSCEAYGVAADAQSAWTPIGPGEYLELGDMPSNSRRSIEVRIRVPLDATPQASMKTASFHVI